MSLFVVKIIALVEFLFNTFLLCPEQNTWSPLASRESGKEISHHDNLNNFRPTLKQTNK